MASTRTRTTDAAGLRQPTRELGSAAQRDRRKRILDATLALASKGGYEAVQMRTVAQRADVALGTLYRYFPSKIHLLVSGLAREFERNQEKLDRAPIPGDTPYDRMLYVLGRITRAMQREPMLTEAMTRAFMFADPSAAAEVNTVARLMEQMLTQAMHEGEPSADDDRHRPGHRRRLAVQPGRLGDPARLGQRREQPARTRRPAAAPLSIPGGLACLSPSGCPGTGC